MKQRLSAKTFFTTDPVLAKHRIPQQLSERRHVSVCKLHSREGRLRVRRHPPKRQRRQICSLPTLSHFNSMVLRQLSSHFRVPPRWSQNSFRPRVVTRDRVTTSARLWMLSISPSCWQLADQTLK